jgi:hypothetical protein
MRHASRGLLLAMLAGAGMSAVAGAQRVVSIVPAAPGLGFDAGLQPKVKRRKRRSASAGRPAPKRHADAPKKHRNRLIISKRVRRKHRRARK